MSRNLHTENMDRLLDGVLTLKTREEAYCFFEDLCTAGELESMQQRFAVAAMLRKDETYQKIADQICSFSCRSAISRAYCIGQPRQVPPAK